MSGEIVHIEWKSGDFGRSAGFYGKLFGWKFTSLAPEMGYTLFEAPGGPAGGFASPESSQAPGALAYIQVDDIEQKLAEIEQAGGRTVLGKMPMGEGGSLAIFADPDGNTVGLWTRTSAPPAKTGKPAAATQPAAARAAPKKLAGKPAAAARKPGKGSAKKAK